ncbi:MAG: threonine ammonia-lyase [Oscillospiraceae bacterium]|nr:threonine ammonia-lyase [Oscillospiraceae bacterium]
MELTLDRIYQAAHLLKDCIRKTDIIPSSLASYNKNLHFKAENLQITGSFKVRGAYFKIAMLSEEERAKGVIACSAGNHAQGVALSAARMGINATIFIPNIAPLSKIEATKQLGARVELVDGVYDDAHKAALAFQEKSGGVFIHPFDDIDVIAGQGTIGLEVLEQLPDLEAIVVPVGGGGLISGIAFAVKKLKPSCKVFGVQAAGAGSMHRSMLDKKRVNLDGLSTFADGIAVKTPGETTFKYCRDYVDGIVTVTDDEIATAILTLMEQQKLVAEGAGAVAVAAVMFNDRYQPQGDGIDKIGAGDEVLTRASLNKLPFDLRDKKTCAIVSGGNIDVNILSRVINRGLLTTGRLSELKIEMLDKPGQLKEVSAIIADVGANVIKVMHNYGGENTDIIGCYLHISMETKNKSHFEEVKNAIQKAGYRIV